MADNTAGRARPLKILFVYEQYLAGGFETHLDAMIEALVETGATIYCLGGSDLSKSPAYHLVKQSITTDFRTFSGSTIEAASLQIAGLVVREQIDLVHAHPFLSFLPAALGAIRAGVPFGATFHGPADLPFWSSYFGGFFVESLTKFVLPRAAFVSCVSQELRASLATDIGMDASKIQVHLNPINLERFRPAPTAARAADDRQCLMVSRLDDDKYQSCVAALELFVELKRQHTGLRFSVAGSGNREAELKAKAESLGLSGIEWLGFRADIADLLQSADLVVGMDRVVLEALASKRLTVLSGYEGLVGVIEPDGFEQLRQGNFGGRGAPRASAVEVARQAIDRMPDNLENAQVLRQKVSESYDVRRIVQLWLQVYEQALGAAVSTVVREESQAALAWLSSVGRESLRGLQWSHDKLSWPAPLLSAPAHNALFRQAVAEHELAAAELRRRVSDLQAECSRLADESNRLADQVARSANRVRLQQGQLDQLHSRLQTAEGIRKLVVGRCYQFKTQFEKQLADYQTQRAWQLMLWCRQAYTLAFRPGLVGKTRFLRFVADTLAGRASYSSQELTFPSLPAYLPPELMEPFSLLPRAPSDTTEYGLPRAAKYDVVILGIIDFDFRFQRPQQLAVRFAAEGHRVFWISPTRFLPPSSPEPFELQPLRERLWEVHLRGKQPDIYTGSLAPAAAQVLLASLCELYRRLGIAENSVLVQLPFWRQLALGVRRLFGAVVLYDCMDDWDTFPSFGSFNLEEERQLAAEADVLVVTAKRLVEKFEPRGLKPLLARNAADYEFFAKPAGLPISLEVPSPIIGYFGAIADWMDLALVEEVARLRPCYSFVLIGKVFGRDVSPLERLPNVHLLGHKEYVEIPSYLRLFDVCTIPFLVNQVTNATDPVKMYEYFSLGKPVVSTAMAELEYAGDLVYTARDAAEFAGMIDRALAEQGTDWRDRRIDFARSNTWKHRYAVMDDAIVRTFPRVSILIVSYNSADFLGPCLDSILKNTAYPNFEIVAVDNASKDETPAVIQRFAAAGQSRLKPFCLTENLGFAGGNNFAASHATGEYLVFLNADTLITPGWLELLLRHCRQDATLGLLAPVTNFAGNEVKINVDYRTQPEMEAFAAALARTNSGQLLDVEVVPLFCAIMARSVWERVGPLDERFAIGMFEDDDFSMRVRAAGLRVAAAEDCFVHHFGQGSFSKLESAEYQRIFEQNRRLFEEKWNGSWKPHRTRPGVRPAHEEQKFEPRSFCQAAD